MRNSITGHRDEAYEVDLLDLDGHLVDQLDGVDVTGGTVEVNVNADIRGSGKLPLSGAAAGIDWLAHLVRVRYVGAGYDEALLTAWVDTPNEQHAAATVSREASLYDATFPLSVGSFGRAYSVTAGENAITKAVEVVESAGISRHVFTPNPSATLTAGLVWTDPNTSKMRIVNDLLAAAGYWSVRADPLGVVRGEPYTAPEQRQPVWTFDRLYLPDWLRERDTFRVVNRVVCIQRVEGDEVPLRAERTLDELAPDSPYTFARRRVWFDQIVPDVNATSLEALQTTCDRLLSRAQQITEAREFEHPWLPGVEPNAVVVHHHDRMPAPLRAVIQKQTHRLETGGLIRSRVRGLL